MALIPIVTFCEFLSTFLAIALTLHNNAPLFSSKNDSSFSKIKTDKGLKSLLKLFSTC